MRRAGDPFDIKDLFAGEPQRRRVFAGLELQ
jgi:hypothetical protein